jgi:hypothetical protein
MNGARRTRSTWWRRCRRRSLAGYGTFLAWSSIVCRHDCYTISCRCLLDWAPLLQRAGRHTLATAISNDRKRLNDWRAEHRGMQARISTDCAGVYSAGATVAGYLLGSFRAIAGRADRMVGPLHSSVLKSDVCRAHHLLAFAQTLCRHIVPKPAASVHWMAGTHRTGYDSLQ